MVGQIRTVSGSREACKRHSVTSSSFSLTTRHRLTAKKAKAKLTLMVNAGNACRISSRDCRVTSQVGLAIAAATHGHSGRGQGPRHRCRARGQVQIGDQAARACRHRPTERAVTSVEEEALHLGRTDDGRAVRRHWAQPCPELRSGKIAGTGEQVCATFSSVLRRRHCSVRSCPARFSHAADAGALVEPRNRHLVGLVQHGGNWRSQFVAHRDRQRVALDRVHRHGDAERREQ